MKKFLFSFLLMSATQLSLAESVPDITGKWKTIDDKTGFSRGDVLVTKNPDGTYSGKVIAIRPLPDKPLVSVCVKCKGELKDAPFVGLKVVYDFRQNPANPYEYINGKMLDPLSGNEYKGKLRLSANNKRLTLRGYIGVSMLGRNQSWVRAED